MKLTAIAFACAALFGTVAATAQDRHDRHDGDRRDDSYSRDGDRRDEHRDDRRDERHEDRRDGRWDGHNGGRNYGWHRSHGIWQGNHNGWSRGDYYRDRGFVVRDYGTYHLRRPGGGYHWVREGNDYLLIAVATGLIADVVINGR
ncbi:MAG: RcnB family protein [Tahibacter sp.]